VVGHSDKARMPLSGRLSPKQLCPSEPGAIRFLIGSLPARNSDRTKSLADLGAGGVGELCRARDTTLTATWRSRLARSVCHGPGTHGPVPARG
jgi:hypothetical protein